MTTNRIALLVAAKMVILSCKDKYAKSYARELYRMLEKGDDEAAIRGQIQYVQCNIQHWKGKLAQTAKILLKS